MKDRKLNLQSAVAMLFIFILVAAAVTTVFGQEKKEKTKVIQLRITEDENGKVTSVDTTFVMDSEKGFNYSWNANMNRIGDSLNVTDDLLGEDFNHINVDSLMKNIQATIDGNAMMFFNAEMDKAMEELDQKLEDINYEFMNHDSIVKVIVKKIDAENDSLEKNFRFKTSDGEDGFIFITSDGEKVEIVGDGETRVIRLKGGEPGMIWTNDTIIEDGNTKIIIKTDRDGDELKQMIEYIAVEKDGDEVKTNVKKDTRVKVIKLTDDEKAWTDDEGNIHKLDGSDYQFISTEDPNEGDLKDAGIKTRNRALEVENLKFSPNPSNGKFNLSFALKEKKKVTINIYDLNGNLVYTETLRDFQGEYNREIDISKEESGPFFLQIVQGMYDLIKKIIIQ